MPSAPAVTGTEDLENGKSEEWFLRTRWPFVLPALFISGTMLNVCYSLDCIGTGTVWEAVSWGGAFFLALRLTRHSRRWRVLCVVVFFVWTAALLGTAIYFEYFKCPPTLGVLCLWRQLPWALPVAFSRLNVAHAAIVVAALACAVILLAAREGGDPPSGRGLLGHGVLALAVLLSAWGRAKVVDLAHPVPSQARGWVDRAFYFRPMKALADYGYGLYLLHTAVLANVGRGSALPNPLSGYDPIRYPVSASPTKPWNVIAIQVESLDRNLLDADINNVPLTPFLRRFREECVYVPNCYAHHGMGGTSDAEVTAIGGVIPCTSGPAMSIYPLGHLPSLAKRLKTAGYQCLAMHGNHSRMWNRVAAYPQLGFDRFISSSELAGPGKTLDDGELLAAARAVMEQTKDTGQPLLLWLITLTMHPPIRIPADAVDSRLEVSDKSLTGWFQAVHYTDACLQGFVETLKASGWLENTALCVFADHTAAIDSEWYKSGTNIGENIPLLLYLPSGERGVIPTYCSHLDIAPTIADLAGLEPDPAWPGRSLLRWRAERLFPVVSRGVAFAVTPAGPVPLDEVVHPLYPKVIDYCRSFFEAVPEQPSGTTSGTLLFQPHFVAHAGGGIDGRTYTNSREAFELNYARGFRFFEMDLTLLADGHVVCAHDHMEDRLKLHGPLQSLTLEQVGEHKLDDAYGMLDAGALARLLLEFPGSYLVTDTKTATVPTLDAVVKVFHEIDPGLVRRIIPQIYVPQELEPVCALADFPAAIFTLYRNALSDQQVLEFVRGSQGRVGGVCMSQQRFSPRLGFMLRCNRVAVFVHTINSLHTANRFFAASASGIYTDALWQPKTEAAAEERLYRDWINACPVLSAPARNAALHGAVTP